MRSPTVRGRVLSVCLCAAALAGSTACGGGAPVAPMAAPEPATAPLDSSAARRPKVKPRTRPQPATAIARKPVRMPTPVRKLPPVRRDSAALERAVTTEHAHWPLAIALARRSGNPDVAEQAAAALVTEAARLKLDPSLLGAVLLIENTPLNPSAVSSQGALGLMQVMPVHRGNYGCAPDLVNIADNICHGARILKHMVRRTKSVPLALKRYNGCVRGRNTPRCYRYPSRVLRTASRLRREILLIAADSSIGYEEALASVPRARRSSRPQLVMTEDSVGTEVLAPMTCASFFGCLRHRWTVGY
jgi:soluble lytic murein transglycosylase-like protein